MRTGDFVEDSQSVSVLRDVNLHGAGSSAEDLCIRSTETTSPPGSAVRSKHGWIKAASRKRCEAVCAESQALVSCRHRKMCLQRVWFLPWSGLSLSRRGRHGGEMHVHCVLHPA